MTSRDVPGISRVQHVAELPKLLGALAAMTGQQLVVARLAEKVALARQTVDRTYLPLLETVFMAVRLPAWSRNLLSRVTRHPKSYVADSGVAAHLLRVDERALADPMYAATGSLMETFVVNEVIRQESFGETRVQFSHYRTHDGVEMDVIAETTDGRVGAVEVKASATVALADFRHLARLRDLLDATGGHFVRGVVLYSGDRSCPSATGWWRCPSPACGCRPNEPTRGDQHAAPPARRGQCDTVAVIAHGKHVADVVLR